MVFDLTQAKVTKFDIPRIINKNIGALEITMKDFSIMQINHSQRYIFQKINDLFVREDGVFLMQMIKQAPMIQVSNINPLLCNHIVMIGTHTNTHIEDNVWMAQIRI